MSVQKRTTKSGKTRWVARYRDHGKREHSRSFDTQKAAKAWLTEQQRALQRGEWVDPAVITVRQLVAEHHERAVNPSTKSGRATLLKNLGDLEHRSIHSVKPSEVEAWMVGLSTSRPWADGKALAPSTVQMLGATLHGVFTKAVNDDVLARHPMRGLTLRRTNVTVERLDIPTADEVQSLIDYAGATAVGRAADPTMAAMIQFAAETGLRAGELCGLRVRSVDFLRREIHVVEQIAQRTGGFAPLKTESSKRVVPLLPVTVDILSGQLARVPRGRDETVFSRSTGKPLTSGDVGARFRKVARGAGVECTFHALRHFYASNLIAQGAPVNLVQNAMGHASASMTLNVYGHLYPGSNELLRGMLLPVRDSCGIAGESEGLA